MHATNNYSQKIILYIFAICSRPISLLTLTNYNQPTNMPNNKMHYFMNMSKKTITKKVGLIYISKKKFEACKRLRTKNF